MSRPTSFRLASAILLSGITIAWAGAAYAVECKTDADCPSGFLCEKGVSMPGCAPGQDCSDAGPIVEEIGSCSKKPLACTTDADCPQYTKCVSSDDTVCWADSSGDSGCEPPDPNAPKYCEYAPIACTSDDSCPEGFACTETEACPDIACPAGQECPEPPDCKPQTYCAPKELSCQADVDCPKDWTCAEMQQDCATTPIDPGSAGAAPAPEPCETSTLKLCTPPGFNGVGKYQESAPASDTSGNASGTTPVPEDSDGGCQLAAGPASSGFAAAWLAAAAALVSIRRRRSR